MSQKQMSYASLMTVLLVLLPALFQLSGIIITIQIAIVIIIGLLLKPLITFIPTITNFLIFMIIQYPIFSISQGSFSNIFISPLFGFNLSYIFSAVIMSWFLNRKNKSKFADYLKAILIGLSVSVLIGMTYYIILTSFI